MAEITLNRTQLMTYLVRLLGLLAEAIGWASERHKKIRFDVPDEYARSNSGGNCLLHAPPPGRDEVEILLGILKKMSKSGRQRHGSKRRKQ